MSCRRRDRKISAGRLACSCAATATARPSAGPCTTLRTINRDTACAASRLPITASARRAADCSGSTRSIPKPAKGRQSVSRAGMAAVSRRRPASAARAVQSPRLAAGIASRSTLHAACAIDKLRRREAASSARWAAHCAIVRARSSTLDGGAPERWRRSNGPGPSTNQSVLFRHLTNAYSRALATLPEVSILPIPNRPGVLHLASELRPQLPPPQQCSVKRHDHCLHCKSPRIISGTEAQ